MNLRSLLQIVKQDVDERAGQQRAALAAIGAGLQGAGTPIQADAKAHAAAAQQGLQRPLWNQKSTGSGYRSWHNSDGSSGQYVPYPGGNGGTIYRSDGGMTTVDPEIGR